MINEQRVSVIGSVNMNMITIDVTQVTSMETGDEVVLIGKQGDLEISISTFSKFSKQLIFNHLNIFKKFAEIDN